VSAGQVGPRPAHRHYGTDAGIYRCDRTACTGRVGASADTGAHQRLGMSSATGSAVGPIAAGLLPAGVLLGEAPGGRGTSGAPESAGPGRGWMLDLGGRPGRMCRCRSPCRCRLARPGTGGRGGVRHAEHLVIDGGASRVRAARASTWCHSSGGTSATQIIPLRFGADG
jgi:hypothetical protein